MLPNWLYGKSKSKLASILGGGGTPADYDQVKAQVTQNAEDIALLDTSNETLTNNVDVLIENGAINLLPIKCPNQTENNVTLTNNNDGSVTISGTASANTYFFLLENSRSHLEIIEDTGKSYTLSGCTSGSGSTYALRMLGSADLVSWYTVGRIQTTEEMTFTEGAYPYYAVRIDVFSGASVNVTIKPMLVDSKYKGPYVPYAMSNKELTEQVNADVMGSQVSLASYDNTNPYTLPADGYISGFGTWGSTQALRIYDSSFTRNIALKEANVPIYVKKGFKVYMENVATDSGANFFPLTYL